MIMNNIEIRLSDRRWMYSAENGLHWGGTAFSTGRIRRSPEQAAERLPLADGSAAKWCESLSTLNGFFALLWSSPDLVVAAVDRVRSIPLFYGSSQGRVFISDDAEWVRQRVGDVLMDPVAREEFRLAGYVTGSDTLYRGVKQLQAGEMLRVFKAGAAATLQTYRYYRFLHTEPAACDELMLRARLDASAVAATQRLIDHAAGRQIVIPLSGGYDSRFIALMLKRLGYKNIMTFTYGIRGNKESGYSRQVAADLGLPWHFVEYSEAQWQSAWHTEERHRFQQWASGWASLPHVQDWIAVRSLKQMHIVDEDCVFVPGHSGDFVAGSHIPTDAFQGGPVDTELLVRRILERHYVIAACTLTTDKKQARWKQRILHRAGVWHVDTHTGFADAFETWDWQERQAKYIVNSVRVYEFFGFDWWLPLWDAEFMELWQEVPLALRKERRWYLEHVKRQYAEQTGTGVSVVLGNSSDINTIGRLARSLLRRFPQGTKHHLKALRYVFVPRKLKNDYLTSHLPPLKVVRLQRNGYSPIGMLVEEFLEPGSQR